MAKVDNRIEKKMKAVEEERLGRQTPFPEQHYESDTVINSYYDIPEVKKTVEWWGLKLFPWQEKVIRDSLAFDKNKKLAHKTLGLSVPRQNGKSEIMVVLIFILMILFKHKIKYTSFNGDSREQIFARCLYYIENNKNLARYCPANKRTTLKSSDFYIECVDTVTGEVLGSCDFITRAGGAGRGGTMDTIFFDEAQELSSAENASLSGTTATRRNGQLYYFGTPPPVGVAATAGMGRRDKNVKPRDFFKILRTKALIEKTAKHTLWNEWGVRKLVAKGDLDAYYDSNPSLGLPMADGNGITVEFLDSRIMSDEDFAVEHLGYWMSQNKARAIDITRWNDLKYTEDVYPVNENTKVAVSMRFKYPRGDRLDVAMAYKTDDLPIFVDVVESFDTTSEWLFEVVEFFEELFTNNNCVGIMLDGPGSETLLLQIAADYGWWNSNNKQSRQGKIMEATGTDTAAAASLIVNTVNDKSIVHKGDALLNTAVEDAGRRGSMRGITVGFESLENKGDMNYLEAASLALLVLKTDTSVDRRSELQANRKRFSFGESVPISNSTKIF